MPTRRNSRSSCLLAVIVSLLALVSAQPSKASQPVSLGANNFSHPHLGRSANLGWQRVTFVWKDINPQPGVWNWSPYDPQIDNIRAQGLQVLGILSWPPAWLGGGTYFNTPPRTLAEWEEFVRRVAQKYRGKVAAYEIWNEPDLKNEGINGVGWNRPIEEPPLYVDFLRAAAKQIRTYAPGTLVLGPALSSNDKYGRVPTILQQIEYARYPDGPGSSFLDVVSGHNNAHYNEDPVERGRHLAFNTLDRIYSYNWSNQFKPFWVTEFGWKTNVVGPGTQREYICKLARLYTGAYRPNETCGNWTCLSRFNVNRAFIYKLVEEGESFGIYYDNGTPKNAVTEYLRLLSYPATQAAVTNASEYPSCFGPSGGGGEGDPPCAPCPTGVEPPWEDLGQFGLADPRAAMPEEFLEKGARQDRREATPTGQPLAAGTTWLDLAARFEDAAGSTLRLAAVGYRGQPHRGENAYLSDREAHWSAGGLRLAIETSRPVGVAAIRSIAAALDPLFHTRCIEEFLPLEAAELPRLGIGEPIPSAGFNLTRQELKHSRATASCGATAGVRSVEALWTFSGPEGAKVTAGAYNYDVGSRRFAGAAGIIRNPSSVHWSNERGTNWWVAVEASDGQGTPDPCVLVGWCPNS